MSDQPPELSDQAGVRSGLRIGGGIIAGIGLLLTIGGFASFLSDFGSPSMSPPDNIWMPFVGIPMLGIGVMMLKAGFLGTATRYVAGEVAPTVKDTLSYAGIGAKEAICAKCGERNSV